MELTKQELSDGRKRLFQMIMSRARDAHAARREAGYLARVSAKQPPAAGISFLDLGQDSFKFAN